MIQLGLQRISKLLRYIPTLPFAVHVAGTNGKGSICAYTSAALTAAGLRVGKFTSPHLIHRRDCVAINNEPVSEQAFAAAEASVKLINDEHNIEASPFELLTATAFKIFTDHRTHVNVIECGMGGGGDATNAYPSKQKLVTVVSKVGLDHQEFLGDTIEDIAKEKCGIFARHQDVIFDVSNQASVLRVIRQEAQMSDAYLAYPWEKSAFNSGPPDPDYTEEKVMDILKESPLGVIPYQLSNAGIAYRAAYTFLDRRLHYLPPTPFINRQHHGDSLPRNTDTPLPRPDARALIDAIVNTTIPGRFQKVDLDPLLHLKRSMILDGAHNSQAIQAVAPALTNLRTQSPSGKITWVVAFSDGKALDEMLAPIIRPGDNLAAVSFGPVDGMPWKHAMPSSEIVDCCDSLRQLGLDIRVADFGGDIVSALKWATSGLGIPVVGIGSLYLVSDILRLLEDAKARK